MWRLNALSGWILYHDSVLVIVCRFTSLRTLWSAVIKSPNFSARGRAPPVRLLQEPLWFWFSSRLRNFGLLGSEYKYCASWMPLSQDVPNLIPCGCTKLCVHQVSGDRTSLLDAISSLRSGTEHEDELEASRTSFLDAISASLLNESCDGGVEDETLQELVANPGTTRGTKLSVLQIILFSSLVNRGFWPLVHS